MKRARGIVLAIALTASVACKKEAPKPGGATAGAATQNTLENTGDPTVVGAPNAAVDPNDPLYAHPHDLPETEAPRDNIDIPTGTQFIPGAPGSPPVAAPVDPLAGSIASAKAGAVPCFAPLPSGDWSATLIVTVTPTGTVTRSEVDPGNVQDAGVISCLKTYASSLSFAPSEGRTLRIDVHVKG